MSAIQKYPYKIRAYHTDATGRLFVHQLLNFFQDAAHNHADGFGFGQEQLTRQNFLWVLSRLTVEISSLPEHGQEVVLSTWVKSIRGSISEREFSISIGEKILVNASSLWFCLSGASHKPARLPIEFSDLMEINDSYATVLGAEKVAAPPTRKDKSNGISVTARYSDIDMVDHVNNATYARWMMDEIPLAYQQRHNLKKIDINYLGECFLGNDLKVQHTPIDQTNLRHEVVNRDTEKVICRMHTSWSK